MSAIHFDYVVDEHMRRYDVIGRNDARRYDLVVVSHIGTNPETQRQIIASELEVELCPQGTLGERIHGHSRHNGNRRAGWGAAGYGLGGVLTATGVGTTVAEGKRTVDVDGRDFLLESPLKAEFALIAAKRCDLSSRQ